MTRKDDPVFNVKFVQLVENHPCLWNSTLPAYSKKEEIQKAWQEVANETKDTVRNCRERWRTIRSSFLRSLKLSSTATGRGKRKYYLSKYLQFLIPYTKTRVKTGATPASVIRKRLLLSAPVTRINHMPLPLVSSNNSDDTKDDSAASDVAIAIAEDDVLVSLRQIAAAAAHQQQQQQREEEIQPNPFQPRLVTIKTENDTSPSSSENRCQNPTATGGSSGNGDSGGATASASNFPQSGNSTSRVVDLTQFAEWIKHKNTDYHRHCSMGSAPDADQSFLNSLHPFLKEMTSRQNRRFKQQVFGLIDSILDSTE